MNEVNTTHPVVSRGNGASSSQGAVREAKLTPMESGKVLPAGGEKSAGYGVFTDSSTTSSISNAMASINDYVQSIQRDLRFSLDEELNRTIVRVVDAESGELIRQIPEEVFLELARKLMDDGEFQLVTAMG